MPMAAKITGWLDLLLLVMKVYTPINIGLITPRRKAYPGMHEQEIPLIQQMLQWEPNSNTDRNSWVA
jgi:hypothetical protein